jgi:hypothetical protein
VKLKQLFEGDVVKGDFSRGKGVDNPDIKAPPGFERFEVQHEEGAKSAKIIGIKKDGKRVQVSVTEPRLAKELVKIYNGGKSSVKLQPVSLIRAFGSDEMAALDEAGVHLAEKPDFWEDLETEGFYGRKHGLIDEVKLKRIEKIIGRKLKVLPSVEIYGMRAKPRSPVASVKAMPNDRMFIVAFEKDGGAERYLADSTGATKYIRFWSKIA